MAEQSRPTVATVFAVLNIIMGCFGLLDIFNISFSASLIEVHTTLNVTFSAIMLVSGLFLIMNKKKALVFTKIAAFGEVGVQALFAIIMSTIAGMTGPGSMMAIVGFLLGTIYPLLLILLLLRSEPVKSFYAAQS